MNVGFFMDQNNSNTIVMNKNLRPVTLAKNNIKNHTVYQFPITLKFLLILILSVCSQIAFSQVADTNSLTNRQKYYFEVSYYGYNLIKPGLKANFNFIFKQKPNEKKTNLLIANAHLGFSWYPHSHFAIFNYYQIAYRGIKSKNGKFFTIALGPGVYRSIYPKTYKVTDDGNVEKIYFPGSTYFSPALTFGSGKELNNKILKARFIDVVLMFLFDYNTNIVPLLNIEIGFKI